MKKKILILAGGVSKERLISLDTGAQVAKELKKNGYKVKICEPDVNLSKSINQFKPNVIFNALHGQFGEDGYIQTILEGFKIPYTHSGVIASSIAMDKEISKKIFIKNKINTPKYIKYSYKENIFDLIKNIEKKLKFPVVIKPINEGSSVNVFICTKKNISRILSTMKIYKQIMIEEFIGGREIQVAIMGNKKLGAIELKPKRKFYENKFYLLEINTQPGMTKLSLVPEIAKYNGISFIKLIEWILKDAKTKK